MSNAEHCSTETHRHRDCTYRWQSPGGWPALLLFAACAPAPTKPTADRVDTHAVGPDSGAADSSPTESGTDDTHVYEDSAGETGTPDTSDAPPPTGEIVLDACLGQNGVAERCTLVTDASSCTDAPCSKLVIVFSGGEMGCATGRGYRGVLSGYASRGYAAVCVNYFETPTGSGTSPYVDEASRIDLAVREATTGAWARTYWTGDDLLLQGISHGATAPVVLMARSALDDQPHWRGQRTTAGCFFDGSYDQAATAALLATGTDRGEACTSPVSHARWLERYCGPGATTANCDLSTEPKALEDTISAASPANFALRALKLFECGSALPDCTGDIVPAAPIQTLCALIDDSPTHACSFVSLPTDSHLTCHADHFDACRTWFEALPPTTTLLPTDPGSHDSTVGSRGGARRGR